MLYVVTACHNRCNITVAFAEMLKKQTYRNWKLLLVDDGSTDKTVDRVTDILPDVIILHGNGNLWWGGALQKAYQWLKENAADNDCVLLCNDDISFPVDFLDIGCGHMDEKEHMFIIGNAYSVHSGDYLDGVFLSDPKTGRHKLLPPGSTGNKCSTRSLFMRVSDMKKVGGFHPILLPHYGSDYEYTMRAFRKGIVLSSYKDLSYQMDEKTTGNKGRKNITLKTLFSKKSQFNPFYKITYILLTTPLHYIPGRIIRLVQGRDNK